MGSLGGIGLLSLVNANPYAPFSNYSTPPPIADNPIITISPSINNTIVGNNATLIFSVTWGLTDIRDVWCNLYGSLVYSSASAPNFPTDPGSAFSCSLPLQGLSLGSHSIEIHVNALNTLVGSLSTTCEETMIVHALPAITDLSLQNKTYTTSEIPLTFDVNVDETTYSWAGYSLDNQANQTIYGNSTLTDLTEGNHSLIVYANDTFGLMGKSDTVFFSVSTPTPSTAPSASVPEFPTWTALQIVATATLLAALFKGRKKQ